MKDPKVTVALAGHGEKPVLLMSRNDSALSNYFDWELETLAALGYLGAQALIGEIVLKMLHAAHPDVFAPYPALHPEERLTGPDDGFQYLLHLSFQDRTRAYLPAMEALIAQHGDAIAAIHRERWPDTRERILRNYPA